MSKNIAINGCGRIGRLTLRLAWQQADAFTIVHLNDVAAIESVAYLIQYDSVHGTWGVKVKGDAATGLITFTEGARTLSAKYTQSKVLADLKEEYVAAKVELVLECTGEIFKDMMIAGTDLALTLCCTGVYLSRKALQPYFDMGVKKVVVSAPVKDPAAVLNIVYGVNHDQYKADVDHIVTAASCTTNCLAPVVKVVLEKLGIKHGCITTIHNITNTQTVVDSVNAKKDDLRRARSGMVNLAPTSTGSATAIALIFPELKGKLNGLAVRVPLTNASITDCVFEVSRATTVDEVNGLLKEASETYLKGILGFEEEQLVSTDYVNDPRSSIVDAACTQVIDGTMVKIYSWYDNEWGYSARMIDVAAMVGRSF